MSREVFGAAMGALNPSPKAISQKLQGSQKFLARFLSAEARSAFEICPTFLIPHDQIFLRYAIGCFEVFFNDETQR